MASPILDLSYRNYDGPLSAPKYRWWAIAKTMMKIALKKKLMWGFMLISAWYYFAMIFILFLMDQFAAQATQVGGRGNRQNPAELFFANIVWKDQFLHAFSYGQIMYMAVALILGAGAIANDNRANALLVYLSKPVTKRDYLMGKWFGVFVPIWLTMLIPSLVFFLYGLLSFRDKGFLSQDPWLFPQLMMLYPVAAAFHASLIVGCSSFFNQGRVAGAAYGGFYILTNFFTHLMGMTYLFSSGAIRGGKPTETFGTDIAQTLFYASVDGIGIGWMKALISSAGSPPFGITGVQGIFIKAPPIWAPLMCMVVLSGLALFIAWRRVRAVEVIG